MNDAEQKKLDDLSARIHAAEEKSGVAAVRPVENDPGERGLEAQGDVSHGAL